jgi:hypothetical protein
MTISHRIGIDRVGFDPASRESGSNPTQGVSKRLACDTQRRCSNACHCGQTMTVLFEFLRCREPSRSSACGFSTHATALVARCSLRSDLSAALVPLQSMRSTTLLP